MTIQWVLLFALLVVAFYTDIRFSTIPNYVNVIGALSGLTLHSVYNGWDGLIYSLIGLFVSLIILLIPYLFKAIGAGDVKLFAAIGAITGVEFSLNTMMYSIVYAGIIGLFILLFRKQFMSRIRRLISRLFGFLVTRDKQLINQYKSKESLQFPFMYAVLPGALTTVYYFFF